MTRKRLQIVAAWVVGNALISMACSTSVIVYLHLSSESWNYLDDLGWVLSSLPLGWFLFLFLPFGWFSIGSLGWGLARQRFGPLALSAMSSLAFGLIWPHWFYGMMSV